MKIIKGKIVEVFERDLYWTRIVFINEDESQKSQVLACVSYEHLMDSCRIGNRDDLAKADFTQWQENVINKWTSLGGDLFNQDIHYDVYANTPEGEANGLDFLMSKARLR